MSLLFNIYSLVNVIEKVENKEINEYTHQYWCNNVTGASVKDVCACRGTVID